MLNALKINSYIKNTICVLVCMLCVRSTSAQTSKLMEAQELAQNKNYAQAIYILEQVIRHEETKSEPHAWYLRASSYFNYFKQVGDFSKSKINYLDTAINSALTSNKFNAESEIQKENLKIIELIGRKFHNYSTVFLKDTLNNVTAEYFYAKYKATTLILNPSHSFKESDIVFYNAIGGIYADLFSRTFENKNSEIAKSALFEVLLLDPKNITANINMGIIFYNQGAKLIRDMDVGTDLSQLDVIQDNAVKLLKQSLPFMSKANELKPNDKRILEGLEGIYHQLNDEEKALDFKKKKEELEKNK